MTDKRVRPGALLLCDCEGSMTLDGVALGRVLGCDAPTVHHHLCRRGIEEFERVAADTADNGTMLTVACTQEAPLFLELLDAIPTPPPTRFVNIRETAGWSRDAKAAGPKIAALLAETAVDVPPARTVPLASDGRALILAEGPEGGAAALAAAERLSGQLDVTVLVDNPGDDLLPPQVVTFAVYRGRLSKAAGHLGAFRIEAEGVGAAQASSRSHLTFEAGADRPFDVDMILDFRKAPSLFPAPEKRDGYFRVDIGDPSRVERALMDASDIIGEFEKPLYVNYAAEKCAHSRSGITGCTRCIDLCPTGAIQPAGDHVAIDSAICAGCGSCAAVCPTGAAAYALPEDAALFQRLRQILSTYADAGGTRPVILAHSVEYGAQALAMMARHGEGLPANVIPFQLNAVTQLGMEFMVTAVAYGAERVLFLSSPEDAEELAGLQTQITLAETILSGLGFEAGGNSLRFAVLDDVDPTAIGQALYDLSPLTAVEAADFLAMDKKRGILSMALAHLKTAAPTPVDIIALPAGAPFGAVTINAEGCTLCLSCVGSCPTAALRDNPDKPQLSFQETACVQCGLCRATCPEQVITLDARMSLTESARRHETLKEEDPFACVRCGKPFGTKATIEKMLEKLAGHPMFTGGNALDRLKMCDNCRVIDMAETEKDPLAGGVRPFPKTTDDYLREREELRQQAAEAMKNGGDKGE